MHNHIIWRIFFTIIISDTMLMIGSSSSHMSGNNIDNRLTSHNKAHDSNSINQNFTIEEKQLQQPHFDHSMPRNVTLKVGQTAFLSCRVKQLGDKLVSWIRRRDLHILSAGVTAYTSDERFQIVEHEESENYTLQIKFAQIRDSGIYECQISTEPKLSLSYRLNVVEAKAVILGPSDLYVKMGSKVILTCVISQGPHDLGEIFWYRGSVRINQTQVNDWTLSYPLRISVETKWTEQLTSRLKILNARLSDSGNYSCVPTSGESSSVMVHVINGEHPQAMQKSSGSSSVRQNRGKVIITQTSALIALVFLLCTRFRSFSFPIFPF